MIRRFSDTLKELLFGIAILWVLVLIPGVIVTRFALYYVIGLTIGSILACFMAITMENGIRASLALGEQGGPGYIRRSSLVRYIVVIVSFALLGIFNDDCIIPAFIGVMLLKAAAFTQPFFHKIFSKITDRRN
ncbi:hypothetical protein SAMN05216249_11127 [Acetitomaculum ruminis DSM 5522]|uniref:ATP synthase I chain n=1 Tax=Acetitomaculum ruminis DSM 5522 TaxID=1120918 RepID=A0A1I0YU31_9FIRM|nr:hypothetical protein [Acetitomaculum ruminis]SFB15950.1 hypothetical protein SAMN05216249_11127 [Acetitomaculum ruminis DSM 5522]